jgi:hypothetical protein
MSNTGSIIFVVLLVMGLGVLVAGGINNWIVDMEYQRNVETHFTYADRASDAVTKADNFNKFVGALEEHNLTSGHTSVWFQDQPNAILDKNYEVALSLQKRLNETAELDPKSEAYQYAMRQFTMQEFCWFPTEAFAQGYALQHGAWGKALTPMGTFDRCDSSD